MNKLLPLLACILFTLVVLSLFILSRKFSDAFEDCHPALITTDINGVKQVTIGCEK